MATLEEVDDRLSAETAVMLPNPVMMPPQLFRLITRWSDRFQNSAVWNASSYRRRFVSSSLRFELRFSLSIRRSLSLALRDLWNLAPVCYLLALRNGFG
jgi:hypothetical protein